MDKKKESVRVRMTRQMLRRAFMELLLEKPIQNITVRELCEKAQINRGTFYIHYTDIFALMNALEEQMVEELARVLEDMGEESDSIRALVGPCEKLFEFLKQNSDMCVILLSENSDNNFVNRLLSMGKAYSLSQYKKHYPKASDRQAEYFYSFVSSGCIGVLRQWMAGDFKDPTELVAHMAQELIIGAAKALELSQEVLA